jgi:hypothetical protein
MYWGIIDGKLRDVFSLFPARKDSYMTRAASTIYRFLMKCSNRPNAGTA